MSALDDAQLFLTSIATADPQTEQARWMIETAREGLRRSGGRDFGPVAARLPERPNEPTREEEDAAAKAIARQAEPVRTKDGLDFEWDRLSPTKRGTYRDWGRAALESRPERGVGSDRRLPQEVEDVSDNGPCDRCGRSDYAGLGDAYWFADNDLWNEIAGDANLLCPRCFTDACRAADVGVGWRAGRVGEIEVLRAERPDEGQRERVARAMCEASGYQADDPHYGADSPWWLKLADAALGAVAGRQPADEGQRERALCEIAGFAHSGIESLEDARRVARTALGSPYDAAPMAVVPVRPVASRVSEDPTKEKP